MVVSLGKRQAVLDHLGNGIGGGFADGAPNRIKLHRPSVQLRLGGLNQTSLKGYAGRVAAWPAK
jgi:hypothetical protein